jgi:hypothetical protein
MDKPPFILKPLNESALQTIPFLIQEQGIKQICELRGLSIHAIDTHTRLIREAMDCQSTPLAIYRMAGLRMIKYETFRASLPPGWEQYILPL